MKCKDRRNFLKKIGISATSLILPSQIIAEEQDKLEEISQLLGHSYNQVPEKIITSLDPHVGVELTKEEMRMADALIQTEIEKLKLIKVRVAKAGDKNLFMYNAHTGEIINEVFWSEGKYVKENITKINNFMRDFRENKVTNMSLASIETIYKISLHTKKNVPLILNSAYRTRKTNNKVGGAKRSKHLYGKAIDFSLDKREKTSLHSLKKMLLAQHNGGVGYYPRHGFIHIDSDKKRYWRG